MVQSLESAISAFDLDRLLIACQMAGSIPRDHKLSAAAHLKWVQASFDKDKDNRNTPQLLRGLEALDQVFGKPDMDDEALLLGLVSRGDAEGMAWGRRHGLTMTKRHLHSYIDYLLGRFPDVDLGKEGGWMVERSVGKAFDAVLLGYGFLRGDSNEALDHLRMQQGGNAKASEIGEAVARLLYRDMALSRPNDQALHYPSDSGCAWFMQHSSCKALSTGARGIMMDEENQAYLIKPLIRRIQLGVASHQAQIIDEATSPAYQRNAGPRL